MSDKRGTRQYRLSNEQIERAQRLYLIERKSHREIAEAIGAPGEKTINNLVTRRGWPAKRAAVDKQIERKAEQIEANALQKLERELNGLVPSAVGLLKETLSDASQRTGSKRLTELQSAKAALSIVNDVSGRDREAKGAAVSLHLHVTSAWEPRLAEAVDVPSTTQQVLSEPQSAESQ